MCPVPPIIATRTDDLTLQFNALWPALSLKQLKITVASNACLELDESLLSAADIETCTSNEFCQRRSEKYNRVRDIFRLADAQWHIAFLQKALQRCVPIDAILRRGLIDNSAGPRPHECFDGTGQH